MLWLSIELQFQWVSIFFLFFFFFGITRKMFIWLSHLHSSITINKKVLPPILVSFTGMWSISAMLHVLITPTRLHQMLRTGSQSWNQTSTEFQIKQLPQQIKPFNYNTPPSPSYTCMYQVWLKSLEIYSSYCLETKIWAFLGPISNSKPDLHNINAQTKFGENPLRFTQVIIQKWKYACVSGR